MWIARRVVESDDVRIRERVEEFAEEVDFSDLVSLAIDVEAWERIKQIKTPPHLVFAHPTVLMAIPEASLHYRGIALLSRKRVEEIAGTINSWERPGGKPRVSHDKALLVSRLYNAVISSIIVDKTDWAMENGYRNILATIGITEDGVFRNIIGQEAERAVKERVVSWIRARDLLDGEDPGDEGSEWPLRRGVRMTFGSEPDIGFWRSDRLDALVEIKGGKDAAGALERLGAIKKTFDEAPSSCKNFLVVGVVTDTMRERLGDLRMERDFDIDRLLRDDDSWADFMDEIFHYTLRVTDELHGSTGEA